MKKYNGGTWTLARFKSFIKSALRSASIRWPPKYQCLKNAATSKKVNSKTGRMAQHYKCNSCKKEFPAKDVQVDHIIPIIDPIKGFTTWDDVISRMFCEIDNLQVLCKQCHECKTTAEKQHIKRKKTND